MNPELNFTLEPGNVVEVLRPHEAAIGTVRKVDENYHIWIILSGVVEFDKIYGVGGGWYISQKIV